MRQFLMCIRETSAFVPFACLYEQLLLLLLPLLLLVLLLWLSLRPRCSLLIKCFPPSGSANNEKFIFA